jgi:predicted dehydrogenase
MQPVKYGVIGTGVLGRHHARWAAQLSEFDLVGVHDKIASKAESVAGETGCRAFASAEALLSECDAVSVAVSTTSHCEITLMALEMGKAVLVEKPIAATIDEADRMIAAADSGNVPLMVGHIERFNPALLALREYELRPSFIEAHRLAAFNPRGADVDVVLDLMIHDIDLCLSMIAHPVKQISASGVNVVSDTEDIANARLTFANGAVANLTASRISLKPMRKLRVFQTSGYFSLDLASKQADCYRLLDDNPRDGEMTLPLGESGKRIGYFKTEKTDQDMLREELQAFADAVRTGQTVPVTGGEGRAALDVALKVIAEGRKAAEVLLSHGK